MSRSARRRRAASAGALRPFGSFCPCADYRYPRRGRFRMKKESRSFSRERFLLPLQEGASRFSSPWPCLPGSPLARREAESRVCRDRGPAKGEAGRGMGKSGAFWESCCSVLHLADPTPTPALPVTGRELAVHALTAQRVTVKLSWYFDESPTTTGALLAPGCSARLGLPSGGKRLLRPGYKPALAPGCQGLRGCDCRSVGEKCRLSGVLGRAGVLLLQYLERWEK